MRPSLTLLLSLVALAHAASAFHLDRLGKDPSSGLIWRRAKTAYERGEGDDNYNSSDDFYMAAGQETAVIEGQNLLCPAFGELLSPVRLRVKTSEDYYAPNIYISEQLDRVEIRRQDPYGYPLNVHVDRSCAYL